MSLIDEGKALLSLTNKAVNRELYEKLVEYLDKVFNLTMERAQIQEDLSKARVIIADFEGKLAFSKKLSLREEAYWIDGDGHPFCMRCWDKHREAIRLKKVIGGGQCPECNVIFRIACWGIEPSNPGQALHEWDPMNS